MQQADAKLIFQYLKPIEWTCEEDNLLKDLIENGTGYDIVATHFTERSSSDCYIRYAMLSGSTFEMAISSMKQFFKSKIPIYREQDIYLVQLKQCGKTWEEISRRLEKSIKSCYDRYKYLSSLYLKKNTPESYINHDEKFQPINDSLNEHVPRGHLTLEEFAYLEQFLPEWEQKKTLDWSELGKVLGRPPIYLHRIFMRKFVYTAKTRFTFNDDTILRRAQKDSLKGIPIPIFDLSIQFKKSPAAIQKRLDLLSTYDKSGLKEPFKQKIMQIVDDQLTMNGPLKPPNWKVVSRQLNIPYWSVLIFGTNYFKSIVQNESITQET